SGVAATATTAEQSTTVATAEQASIDIAKLLTFDAEDNVTAWTTETSTAITLAGTSGTIDGAGAEAKDGSVTINAAGTYVLSGKLSDGQIVVDVQDEGTVRLVLNGVEIHDGDSAPIYVKEAEKTIITLAEGTENVVADGATYVFADAETDEPSAAIFSKSDLTINGTGKLSVTAKYKDGITSKDELRMMTGTIAIQAADDGIIGKDMVAVQEGKITIIAEGDGIKSTNDEDAEKGFISIAGGTFDIKAGSDGIQAETSMLIAGGTYTMVTGGGNENGEVKTGDRGQGPMGNNPNQSSEQGDGKATATETVQTTTETPSAKGLKAGGDITINDGSFTIDSADDALHGNGNVAVTGGDLDITSGDDGIHADALVTISGGVIVITKSYEGIEGANITISGGEAHVVASDDGVNVAGGNDGSSMDGRQGQNGFSAAGSNLLIISGGTLTVDAAGDGLDSNGSMAMSGGTVVVSGPTNDGNGALDYDGDFTMSGGFLVAAGSSGMAQAPSEASSQFSMLMNFTEAQQAGTIVHLEDSAGNNILTFAPTKNYSAVVISSPDLKKDGSYTLYSGGTATGSETNGYYADGAYEGGTKVVEFKIVSSVTWLNESGVTTANTNQGPGGGGGGNRPQGGGGGTKPEGQIPMK
ncbi:MAG: carbohydrate-binding domain-containing protein, partial [Gorillibacterium sp.]|nr:carbohydrate-binding domain-containing protein [Gorillibacterium sp.]